MSNIKLSGNPSGTGTLTIASPNTNSDYTLNLPASSGTVLADGASQSPTFNGVTATTLTVNSNNISAVNSLGFRNRIINGDMRIDQRNAGASVTPANADFIVDRFQYIASQASKVTAQQNAGSVTPPAGFTKYLGITSSSAYSIGATDYFNVSHKIEGFNTADLAWGTANAATVTLSFWVRSSLTGTFGGTIFNNAQNRYYPFSYTISAANTWEQKTITIAGDTSGTWATDNSVGIRIMFGLGVGSTYSGTAGSWGGTLYYSVTGATSVVGTNGATFYITGVQLEAGSVATPFERRDYGRELMMCQRYFCKSFNVNTAPAKGLATSYFAVVLNQTGSSSYSNAITFPASMRVIPSMTFYNSVSAAAADGTWQVYASGGSSTSVAVVFTSAYAGTQFFSANVVGGYVLAYGDWTASAEL